MEKTAGLIFICFCIFMALSFSPATIEAAPTATTESCSNYPIDDEDGHGIVGFSSEQFNSEPEIAIPECVQEGCHLKLGGLAFVCCKYFSDKGLVKQYESPPCDQPDDYDDCMISIAKILHQTSNKDNMKIWNRNEELSLDDNELF